MQLEGFLRGKDAIMEPNVMQVVGKYVQAGGKPQQVIEDLSENYEGSMPDMWL